MTRADDRADLAPTEPEPPPYDPGRTERATEAAFLGGALDLFLDDDGWGASPTDGPPPRSTRYEVKEEIGRGGMATVHRAFDRELRRHVAIKFLHDELRAGPEFAERFVEEAQATGQLQHPGIVPVYDVGTDGDGRPFFAMKLVRGRTFAEVVRDSRADGDSSGDRARGAATPRLRLFHLLQLLIDVAQAIHYAHERGVVHRDLKPQNVMIGSHGEVHVMDWGLAKVAGDGRRDGRGEARADDESAVATSGQRADTRVGAIIGTPSYMAPEQADGDPSRISAATDVYALGAILFHVLTGTAPFRGTSTAEVLNRVLNEGAPHPRELDGDVPRELDAVCRRAMAMEPRDRYPSARHLGADLQAYLEGRRVSAYSEGVADRARRLARRHPGVTATAGLALLIGLIGALIAIAGIEWQRRRATGALARVLRLSDVKRLAELEASKNELWPATRDRVDDLTEWLKRADDLARRLELHEANLATLGEPGTSADMVTRWQHDTLADLVGDLERLRDETIPSVRARLENARDLHDRSIADHQDAWDRARRSIGDRAACPRYDGLSMTAQEGLVPLARDADTGLWEFWHVPSGERPERGRDGKLIPTGRTGLVLVLVPGGGFDMGARRPAAPTAPEELEANEDPNAQPDEVDGRGRPVRVRLAPFFISKYEMTQGQWRAFTGANPSRFGPDQVLGGKKHSLAHPVEQVSWSDGDQVLFRLGLRLPTEAQWEYAARAETTTPWWTGNDERSVDGAANLADSFWKTSGGPTAYAYVDWLDDGWATHAPVGTYRANGFGLHDVAGNVWEWCRDGYGSYDAPVLPGDGLRDLPPSTDPRYRVYRGGGWSNLPVVARSANRYYETTEFRNFGLGVRPARPIAD